MTKLKDGDKARPSLSRPTNHGQSKPGVLKRRMNAFNKGLAVLKAYAKREASANPKASQVEMGPDGEPYLLGNWVSNIRSNRHRLEPEMVQALESIEGWTWRAWDRDWDKGIQALKAFRDRHGHTRCRYNHVEDGFRLGSWLACQRRRYKNERLTPEQAAQFEALVDVRKDWQKDRAQKLWSEKYKLLCEFAKQHGHTRIPRNYTRASHNIGTWVNSVRAQYNRGKLSADRIEQLQNIPGWEWARSRADAQQNSLNELNAYVAKFGTSNVPRTYVSESGFRLGEWVHRQRARRGKGGFSSQLETTLESLPGWKWSQPQKGPRKKRDGFTGND